MGHIFVPWRALKLCAQLRVPASRKCISVRVLRVLAQSPRERTKKPRAKDGDREERLPREKVEEKRLIVNDRERKRIHKRARNCNLSPFPAILLFLQGVNDE